MLNAITVAQHFLAMTNECLEETFTHMKLQKLLYYAQGFHLAHQGRPLFADPIEAWEHGPVVRTVYDAYKAFGSAPLPKSEDVPVLPEYIRDLLDAVYLEYGQYSAGRLRTMTHEETPWIEAIQQGRNTPFDAETMKRFFRDVSNKINDLTEDDLTPVTAPALFA